MTKLTLNRIALKVCPYVPKPVRAVVKRLLPKHVYPMKTTSVYPIWMSHLNIQKGLDVLLLELPQRYMPFMPVGLGYVAGILKRMGVKYQVVDYNIEVYHQFHSRRVLEGLHSSTGPSSYKVPDDPWTTLSYDEWTKPDIISYFDTQWLELAHAIETARPKILGLSVSATNRLVAQRISDLVRKFYPEVIILIGGYDCIYPEVVTNVGIDYDCAVIGEAEGTLPRLLSVLMAGEKPCDLPGVLSKYDSPGRKWEAGPLVQNLDSLDWPRYEWTDPNCYQSYEGFKSVPVISSRGCVWGRCRFCVEAGPYRKRSPKSVVDELEWFLKRGFYIIQFNDSDILGDHMFGICQEIIERGLKLSFGGQCRIQKHGTPVFYQTLKAAGCGCLNFGVDGWSDRLARLQNKGYTMDMVRTNLHNCHAAGIQVNVNMVIGVPGETEDDISDCIANIISMKDDIDDFQSLNLLTLFVGSEYWCEPEKYGIKFRGDKAEIVGKYHYYVPPDLWYSEGPDEPYIDQSVRAKRMYRIYKEIKATGVHLPDLAEWQVQSVCSGVKD